MASGGSGGSERARTTAAVLRVLADLAPDQRPTIMDVSGSGPTRMAWLGTFRSSGENGDPTSVALAQALELGSTSLSVPHTPAIEGLGQHDALTPESDDLRLGWLWLVGPSPRTTGERMVLPLLSRAAKVRSAGGQFSVEPIGPWDLLPLVQDPAVALRLERSATFGGGALEPSVRQELVERLPNLRSWTNQVAKAALLGTVSRLLAPTDPTRLRPEHLVAVVGFGLYAEQVVDVGHPRETLEAWSRKPASASTAFSSLFLPDMAVLPDRPPPPPVDGEPQVPLIPSLALNERQADVVRAARHRPVTVVSGPPGTGKSQTAAAVALDCVAQGQSVLVATRSAVAADVLAGLLDQLPGPDPVMFGGGILARKLAVQLADGLEGPSGRGSAQRELERAWKAHADLEASARIALEDQRAVDEWDQRSLTLPRYAEAAPLLLDIGASVDPEEASLLFGRLTSTSGALAEWRQGRIGDRLRSLVGAHDATSVELIGQAVELARLRDRAARAHQRDPNRSAHLLDALVAADERLRVASGQALDAAVAARADGDGRRAVAALALALRSGRSARRAHLARVDMGSLTQVLPLWVGTLGQIETLLPATAAAFDVVILDEASQIDLMSASAALLRARRAVVIGDPRQLRFVSFVADATIRTAIEKQRLTAMADRLDVRRTSAFDLAAGTAPVTMLDEHFRCAPHLIGFSAERFYDGRLQLASRHPANDATLAIEVRRLGGERVDGVNVTEVEAAVTITQQLLASDADVTIGLVSPYRAQVEAMETLLTKRVRLEELADRRVRVGTVHGFQGAECDVVIASFGIGGSADRGRGFLEDPNLFNVLITRAKRSLIVLSSGDLPETGLLADYLRWAATTPRPPVDVVPKDPWTARLAVALRDAGQRVRTGYPVGRWTIDLVVGDGDAAVAVATRVHSNGPDAHLARHLALARAGWRQAEAFAGDNDGDVVVTALALAELTHPAGEPTTTA